MQAGKLATLGELTTGVAHELNNPLNNIGLFVGQRHRPRRGSARSDNERIARDLEQRVRAGAQGDRDHLPPAHLRPRRAGVLEPVAVQDVIEQSALAHAGAAAAARDRGRARPRARRARSCSATRSSSSRSSSTCSRTRATRSRRRAQGDRRSRARWQRDGRDRLSRYAAPEFPTGSSSASSTRSSRRRTSARDRASASPSPTESSRSTAARSPSRTGPARGAVLHDRAAARPARRCGGTRR